MHQPRRYGVIGKPVVHSLSPQIHSQFAAQLGHLIDYRKYLVEPDNLGQFIKDFFTSGGNGLNVTLPYKQAVINLLDRLSHESQMTGSVNTLSINDKGQLVGDTTDGKGLLLDLDRHGWLVEKKKLLVIGAGGASQSIIVALMKAGASITLHNRSQDKVARLITKFSSVGEINAFNPNQQFDGIISSITKFNSTLMAPVKACIGTNTFCYDLNYAHRAEAFRAFALANGCNRFSDGLGMLIGQAAISYQIWSGQLPDISSIKIN